MHAIPKDGARVLHASQKLCSTHWFDVNRGVGYCVDTREAEFSLHLLDSKLSGVADRAFMDLVVGFHLEESFVEESALDGDLAGDNSVYFDRSPTLLEKFNALTGLSRQAIVLK